MGVPTLLTLNKFRDKKYTYDKLSNHSVLFVLKTSLYAIISIIWLTFLVAHLLADTSQKSYLAQITTPGCYLLALILAFTLEYRTTQRRPEALRSTMAFLGSHARLQHFPRFIYACFRRQHPHTSARLAVWPVRRIFRSFSRHGFTVLLR